MPTSRSGDGRPSPASAPFSRAMVEPSQKSRPRALGPPLVQGVRSMADRVGYRSPPEHSRWQKGQSGNPRGRPKGIASIESDLLAELGQFIQIKEGGKPKRITK